MKRTISLLLAALMLMGLLSACGDGAAHVFTGSYLPDLPDAVAIEFRLELKSDGTLTVTPGMMLSLDDQGKIVTDQPATGTWSEADDGTLTMTINAAGDETFSMEYTVEKLDGYYEFEMMLSLAGYKRPIVMTSN